MTADRVSDEALEKGRALGLSKADLLHAVANSAPYTHDHFNRRFERLLLRVERGALLDVFRGAHRPAPAPEPVPQDLRELLRSARDAIRDLLPDDPKDDPDAGDNARYVLELIEDTLGR